MAADLVEEVGGDVPTAVGAPTPERERPTAAVVHAGCSQLDAGHPILVTLDEVRTFALLAPAHMAAVHLQALDHWAVTPAQIQALTTDARIGDRLRVPEDGETLELD